MSDVRVLDGAPATTDPWRPVPDGRRDNMHLAPGGGATKARGGAPHETRQHRHPREGGAHGPEGARAGREMDGPGEGG